MKYKILIYSILACLIIYLLKNQYYNWDIEAYMGLVYKIEHPEASIEEVHDKVYGELKFVAPHIFTFDSCSTDETEGSSTYYKTLSENPKAYGEELQLFAVKPFFTFLNYLFYKLGFSLSASIYLPSIISFCLIILLIYNFLIRIIDNKKIVFCLLIGIMFFRPLLHSGRHATPDMVSCYLLLLGFYFLFRYKSVLLFTIFAMLNIFTRPEYIVFYSLILTAFYFFKKTFKFSEREIVLGFIYTVLSFLLIQYFNTIPWRTLFMNQFLKVQIYPISNPDVFDYNEYIKFIKSHIVREFNESYFVLLVIFAVAVIGIQKKQKAMVKFVAIFRHYTNISLHTLSHLPYTSAKNDGRLLPFIYSFNHLLSSIQRKKH